VLGGGSNTAGRRFNRYCGIRDGVVGAQAVEIDRQRSAMRDCDQFADAAFVRGGTLTTAGTCLGSSWSSPSCAREFVQAIASKNAAMAKIGGILGTRISESFTVQGRRSGLATQGR